MPRLLEDLDFDVKDFSSFDYRVFIKDLKKYFVSKLKYKDFEVKVSGKNRPIYLKFPILKKLVFRWKKKNQVKTFYFYELI